MRVLLVEPGYTSTGFEDNTAWSDSPLPVYDGQRAIIKDVISAAMREADDPAVVAKVIVTAATAAKPRVRYPAGALASRVSILRRLVPWRAFDKQIRKLNRLAG